MKSSTLSLALLPCLLASCVTKEIATLPEEESFHPGPFPERVPINQVTFREEMKKPPVKFRRVKVTTRHSYRAFNPYRPFHPFETGEATSRQKAGQLPPLVLRTGQEKSVMSVGREFIYPTAFDFPEIPDEADVRDSGSDDSRNTFDVFPVTPSNPTAFEMRPVGQTLTLSATARDSFIMLNGVFRIEDAKGFVNGAGVPMQPIVVEARGFLGRKFDVIITDNEARKPAFVTTEYPIHVAARPGEWYRIPLDRASGTFIEIHCEILD